MGGLLLLLSVAGAQEGLSELQAESLAVREDLVRIEKGRIVDEDGVLNFESGSWDRTTGQIDFSSVEVELTSGWFIRAQSLRGLLDGRAVLEDATITACDCECPVWSVQAVSLVVEGLEDARVEGGSLVVFEGFSLPFPGFSFPLRPGKVGLGLPGIGWELGSLRVNQPVVLRLGEGVDAELKPGWWRGPFLEGGVLINGDPEVSWRVEWADEFAALAQVDHVTVRPQWSAAISGIWVDRPESQGRAVTYLDRQRSFLEQQAVATSGWLRAEGWAWQDRDTDGARWQFGVREQGWQRGAFSGSHGLMTGLMLGRWRSELRVKSGWIDSWGPLELSVDGVFRGLDYDASEQAADVGLEVDAGLVATGHHGGWRHEVKLGAAAGVRERIWGELVPSTVFDRLPDERVWGPRLEAIWWGNGHLRITGWAHLREGLLEGWETSGLFKRGSLDWRIRSWRVPEASLHGLTLYERGERSETWFGLHAQREQESELQPVMNAGVRFAIPVGSFDVWPAATVLMSGKELESATGSLTVESTCDCLRVGLDAGWTLDREEVILGLSLDLLPTTGAPSSWAIPSPDTGSFSRP